MSELSIQSFPVINCGIEKEICSRDIHKRRNTNRSFKNPSISAFPVSTLRLKTPEIVVSSNNSNASRPVRNRVKPTMFWANQTIIYKYDNNGCDFSVTTLSNHTHCLQLHPQTTLLLFALLSLTTLSLSATTLCGSFVDPRGAPRHSDPHTAQLSAELLRTYSGVYISGSKSVRLLDFISNIMAHIYEVVDIILNNGHAYSEVTVTLNSDLDSSHLVLSANVDLYWPGTIDNSDYVAEPDNANPRNAILTLQNVGEESQDEENNDATRHTLTFQTEEKAIDFRRVWNDDPGDEEDDQEDEEDDQDDEEESDADDDEDTHDESTNAVSKRLNENLVAKQVDIVFRTCQHEVVHRSQALKQAYWLTFGSMVGELCQQKTQNGEKTVPVFGSQSGFVSSQQCSSANKEAFKQALLAQYREAQSTYEKVLALKALGIAGIDTAAQSLEKIINSPQENRIVRVQAIDALRRLRSQMPRKIQRILLPFLQNTCEYPAIRMSAFAMILHTTPERPILDQVAYTLNKERNSQVQAFAYSALKSLSESKVPCQQQMARQLKSVLHLTNVDEQVLQASCVYHIPIYSEQQQEGVFVNLISTFSHRNNILPNHLAAVVDTMYNDDFEMNGLKVALTQQGLEQWYEGLIQSMLKGQSRSYQI